jgi:hypothetical protein
MSIHFSAQKSNPHHHNILTASLFFLNAVYTLSGQAAQKSQLSLAVISNLIEQSFVKVILIEYFPIFFTGVFATRFLQNYISLNQERSVRAEPYAIPDQWSIYPSVEQEDLACLLRSRCLELSTVL